MDFINDPGSAKKLIGYHIPLGGTSKAKEKLGGKPLKRVLVRSIVYDPKSNMFIVNGNMSFTVDLIRKIMIDLVIGELRT